MTNYPISSVTNLINETGWVREGRAEHLNTFCHNNFEVLKANNWGIKSMWSKKCAVVSHHHCHNILSFYTFIKKLKLVASLQAIPCGMLGVGLNTTPSSSASLVSSPLRSVQLRSASSPSGVDMCELCRRRARKYLKMKQPPNVVDTECATERPMHLCQECVACSESCYE